MAQLFGWHSLQLIVVGLCGMPFWRAPRQWKKVRSYSLSGSQRWLAAIGWLGYTLGLAAWVPLFVLVSFTWLAQVFQSGSRDAVATLMITVFVLPVSLLLCSMLGMATDWIEEVEQNRIRAAAKQEI